MTDPHSVWSPSQFGGSLSAGLGSAHGDLAGSLGFKLDSLVTTNDADNPNNPNNPNRDTTQSIFDPNDFDLGDTVTPIDIDGKNLIPTTPPSPAPAPSSDSDTTTTTTGTPRPPPGPSTSLRPPAPSASDSPSSFDEGDPFVDDMSMTILIVTLSILGIVGLGASLFVLYKHWKTKRIERYLSHQRKKRDKKMRRKNMQPTTHIMCLKAQTLA